MQVFLSGIVWVNLINRHIFLSIYMIRIPPESPCPKTIWINLQLIRIDLLHSPKCLQKTESKRQFLACCTWKLLEMSWCQKQAAVDWQSKSDDLSHDGVIWGNSSGDRWIPFTKGRFCRTMMFSLLSARASCWKISRIFDYLLQYFGHVTQHGDDGRGHYSDVAFLMTWTP